MRWIHRAMSALRAILRRRQVERELDAELQFHVEQQIAENVEAGMTADEARAAAWRSLGSVTALREECRDALGTAFVDQLGQDVRYCFRTLRRSPGFSVAAILSMALGIGVNTALFSIADGVLLKPLPYRNAERLVRLPEYRADARSAVREPMLSNVTLEAWRRSARALDGLAPYSGRAYTVTRAGDAEYVSAAAVSPELFRILDVSPVAGRFFDASEAIAGADHVTVLGYEYWDQRFGGSAAVVGTSITLDAQPYEIVGVAPPGFSFPDPGRSLYTPFVTPRARTSAGEPQFHLLSVLGRLAPGATVAQAEAEGTAVARGLGPLPVVADMLLGRGGPAAVRVRTIIDDMTSSVRPILVLLGVGAVLVLLVGCANVANLFLARGVIRARELAVRAALGAGRARIARLLITESLVIAAGGGIVGALGAWGLVRLWPTLAPRTFPRIANVRFDATTMVFAVAMTLVAGLLAGSVPAIRKTSLLSGLREAARASSGRTANGRRAFIVVETACAAVLLIASALLIRSFVRLLGTDTGYDASHVITARITLQGGTVTPSRWRQVAGGVLDRIRATPGVEAAGAASMAPLGDSTHMIGFRLSADRSEPVIASGLGYVVTPGYAEALHLRLREGRLLRQSDVASATQAIVVNERFVSLYLNDGRPVLGRRYAGLLSPNATAEIVGVVGDVLKNGFLDKPQPEFYVVAGNQGGVSMGREINLVMRAAADPRGMIAELRAIGREVSPDGPIHNVTLLTTELSATAGESRFASTMFGAFAVLALCLAMVGLYGVLSYEVSERRRELGVRAALGATRRSLMMLVMREGLGLTALGLILGVAAAAASARLIRALIFNMSVLDGVSFASGPLILVIVALVACAVPAWRASSRDPIDALRSE